MRISHVARAGTASAAAVTLLTASPAQAAPEGAGTNVLRQVSQVVAEHPGARQTGPGTVTFDNGAVLTIPAAGATAGLCASGWYCFFQNTNYGGRKLSFRDCGATGLWQFLTDYGFGNSTSSWQNFTKHTVLVYDQDTQPPSTLWTENPSGESTNAGGADNKADAFETFCG
ncbi:hypothetical protein GCM10022254_43200 [Actinomadura meridiana]|uniref:Peptidase inhibitor family I36 n=1 Tax=Actinomadura meridiana TaxID=559626 RepID=A0ABP8C8P9_9ACTN